MLTSSPKRVFVCWVWAGVNILKIILTTTAIFLATVSTAHAGVAECRRINDDAARLKCYDKVSLSSAEDQLSAPLIKSGWYVGASIGGSATQSINGPVGDLNFPSGFAGGVVGYNAFHGPILTGIELDVRSALQRNSQGFEYGLWEAEFPTQVGWSEGWAHGRTPGTVERSLQAGGAAKSDQRFSYTISEKYSPTLSARMGYAHDNWLFYARLGGGGALIKETTTMDDSRSIYCTQTAVDTHFPSERRTETYHVGCVNPYAGDVAKESKSTWVPTTTLAAGVEYHFDNYFVRGEAEVRHTFINNRLSFSESDGVTNYQFGTTLGVKF